jgi:hypothetical protein
VEIACLLKRWRKLGGGREGNPRQPRIFFIESGGLMARKILIRPPQRESMLNPKSGRLSPPQMMPDGRALYYNNVDATMVVPVETDPQFKLNGMPTVLFRGTAVKITGPEWADRANFTYWDVDPTGKRLFLMLKDATEAPRKINIVVNRMC